jgi:hypothetical protein
MAEQGARLSTVPQPLEDSEYSYVEWTAGSCDDPE